MIGRDFSHIGKDTGVFVKYGDGHGFPFKGPIKPKFLDATAVAVVDADRGITIQRLGGSSLYVCAKPVLTEAEKLELQRKAEEEDEDDPEPEPESTNTAYVDITPLRVCPVPMTQNVAIADATDEVKVVNKHEWYIDRTLGGKGIGLGRLSHVTGLDSFQVGVAQFYCVCEAGNNRVQVLTEGGKHVISISGMGPVAGQFRDPVDIAAFACPVSLIKYAKTARGGNTRRSGVSMRAGGEVSPPWYHGLCIFRDLHNRVARKLEPGSYALGKRPDDHALYDFLYVRQAGEGEEAVVEHVVFRVNVDEDGNRRIFNCTEDDLGINVDGYACIWEAIVSFHKHLRHPRDERPYVDMAVADKGNGRVQVLRYYHSVLQDIYVPTLEVVYVVGGLRKRFIELLEPVAVTYTPTGELVVCDDGLKKVVLLSHRMDVLHVISMGFEVQKNIHLVNSRPGTQQGKRLESGLAAVKTHVHQPFDLRACGVTCSKDHKIAVGFRCGGLLVFRPYKSYTLGVWELLPQSLGQHIVSFCAYSDVETLRNCCRFMHDWTLRLRAAWCITGMRPMGHARMVYSFVRWAKTPENLPGLWLSVALVDAKGTQICKRHLEGRCGDRHCRLSHELPELDIDFIASAADNSLDYDGCCTAVAFVFSSAFLWAQEVYIKELFNFYAVRRKTQTRRDPMTRRNEVLRNVSSQYTEVLSLRPFMAMMTALEEDFAGLKSINRHPLFNGAAAKKRTSAVMKAIKEKTLTSLADVSVAHCDVHHDIYDPHIDIPPVVSKASKFRVLPDMDRSHTRGEGAGDVVHHIKATEHVADRLDDMLSGLFS